jgi:phosphoglucomutase
MEGGSMPSAVGAKAAVSEQMKDTRVSRLAGRSAPNYLLVDVAHLECEYVERRPDVADPNQMVKFGTSGHRGSPLNGTFTEAHVQAITQAICDYRRSHRVDGPVFLGKDTHALSGSAYRTALEVLAANNVETIIQRDDGVTPTPVISRAILAYNRGRKDHVADGIIITPSHNPPADGGLKYNLPTGGPANDRVAHWVQNRANQLLQGGNREVSRIRFVAAISSANNHEEDFLLPYVQDLRNVVDIQMIREAGIKLGADPLGGASTPYWEPISSVYGIDIILTNPAMDPTFSFVPVDHDGVIRMDCSSPYVMARLVGFKDRYGLAFANDPDANRHGIVTPSGGLVRSNDYLVVAVRYLLTHRPRWCTHAAVGKSVVSSSMIDRVVERLNRRLCEVPVGFKWLAEGLYDGSYCFGGEESAGATFLRTDGSVWTTDKDGIVMNLLAAEMTAATGNDPSEQYRELAGELGTAYYTRIDVPASPDQKARLRRLTPDNVKDSELAGDPVLRKLTRAPGNNALMEGLKVVTERGWFAARPSGTEDLYKIYAESFAGEHHLQALVSEAQRIVDAALL